MDKDLIKQMAGEAGFDVGDDGEVYNPHTSDQSPVTDLIEQLVQAVARECAGGFRGDRTPQRSRWHILMGSPKMRTRHPRTLRAGWRARINDSTRCAKA